MNVQPKTVRNIICEKVGYTRGVVSDNQFSRMALISRNSQNRVISHSARGGLPTLIIIIVGELLVDINVSKDHSAQEDRKLSLALVFFGTIAWVSVAIGAWRIGISRTRVLGEIEASKSRNMRITEGNSKTIRAHSLNGRNLITMEEINFVILSINRRGCERMVCKVIPEL